MRVVVIGTSGAGKTTLAAEIAARFSLPHVELDAINWQANWTALSETDTPAFVHRVDFATRAAAWVVDGSYGPVRAMLWDRATHLVWLDYDRPVIMRRVLRRSFLRAVHGTRLWAGNQESVRAWLKPWHPIRWAWSTWRGRRAQTTRHLNETTNAHLVLLHLRHPSKVAHVFERLAAARQLPPPTCDVQDCR